MYRQILVRPSDCAYQHILWRNSPNDEVVEYELLTVTYGISSAPFLAIRCLHELDRIEGPRFSAAKGILTNKTYVDDIIVGADSVEDLLVIQEQLIALLNTRKCILKKWTSNCSQILERVPVEDCAQSLTFDPKGDHTIKVLGLHWDPDGDSFTYHTYSHDCKPTKRSVLSAIARLFDPVGTLGPSILWAKSLMQQLWHAKLEWDTPLPIDMANSWNRFIDL